MSLFPLSSGKYYSIYLGFLLILYLEQNLFFWAVYISGCDGMCVQCTIRRNDST